MNLANKLLGPTYPGKVTAAGTYLLAFKGVSFEFALTDAHRAYCLAHPDVLPVEFPDRTTAPALRVFLARDAGSAPLVPSAHNDYYLEPVLVAVRVRSACTHARTRIVGLTRRAASRQPSRGVCFVVRRAVVRIGMPAQDVALLLGPPDTVHQTHHGRTAWNYRRHGVDIVMRAGARVRSVVLRANTPGHVAFAESRKCAFAIVSGAAFDSVARAIDGAKLAAHRAVQHAANGLRHRTPSREQAAASAGAPSAADLAEHEARVASALADARAAAVSVDDPVRAWRRGVVRACGCRRGAAADQPRRAWQVDRAALVLGPLPRALVRSDDRSVTPFPQSLLYIWRGLAVESTVTARMVTACVYSASESEP